MSSQVHDPIMIPPQPPLSIISSQAHNLPGFRFLLAFILLAPFFARNLAGISAVTLFRGMTLGFTASLVMAAEVTGIPNAPDYSVLLGLWEEL